MVYPPVMIVFFHPGPHGRVVPRHSNLTLKARSGNVSLVIIGPIDTIQTIIFVYIAHISWVILHNLCNYCCSFINYAHFYVNEISKIGFFHKCHNRSFVEAFLI